MTIELLWVGKKDGLACYLIPYKALFEYHEVHDCCDCHRKKHIEMAYNPFFGYREVHKEPKQPQKTIGDFG